MGRATTRSLLALLVVGPAAGCPSQGFVDEALSRHEPVQWTQGRSWVPGRVPGRADHEKPAEGPTQSYAWRSWEVEVEPAEVVGYPGQMFIVDVHMRPAGEDVAPVDLLHGKWMWFALAIGTVQLPPTGGTIRTHTLMPLEGTTASLKEAGGDELPGVGLRVLEGETIGTVVPSVARDDTTFPAGVSARADGRDVRIVYALGRHDHRDCRHAVEPVGDFELQRTAERMYLLLGTVEETSSTDCEPGGPYNPRVEAAVTLPTSGTLGVTIFSNRNHPRDPAGPHTAASTVTLPVY